MVNEENASIGLMADIVHIAQRTSAETCDVAARTIARQALQFLKKYPENIKSVHGFQQCTRDLCECLLLLRSEVSSTNEEILIKRDALDILLLISAELVYPKIELDNTPVETEFDTAQIA